MIITFTSELRRETCIHEAAHAVVHAIGGSFANEIKVAHEGSTDWVVENSNGELEHGLWGCCHIKEPPTLGCLHWDENQSAYIASSKLYAMRLRHVERLNQRGAARELRRQLRAHICGSLAGPIAEGIHAGQQAGQQAGTIFLESEGQWGEDVTLAEGLCFLLPFRWEFDHLATITERILRESETWRIVTRVADALELHGRLEGDELLCLLPPRASERGWPPSPRKKII